VSEGPNSIVALLYSLIFICLKVCSLQLGAVSRRTLGVPLFQEQVMKIDLCEGIAGGDWKRNHSGKRGRMYGRMTFTEGQIVSLCKERM
jgi:hypothetical protein